MRCWQSHGRTFRQDLPILLAALLYTPLCCSCGGGSGSTSEATQTQALPAPGSTLGAVPSVTSLSDYKPPTAQIVVGCESDGSLSQADLQAYVAAQNADLQGWLKPTWGIDAIIVDGPGDGRYEVSYTGHPLYNDQGYSLMEGSMWLCCCNMPLSLAHGTPTASASHELYNTLVSSFGGPLICGPVSPDDDSSGITDATTPAYWHGGARPWDRDGKLSGPYPAVVSGGGIGL